MRAPEGAAAALLAALLLSVPAVAPAQQEPAIGQGFTDQVSVGYVLVPVSVRSRSGFVADLEQEEFRLEVDGRRVDFDWFERGDEAPVSLAFLQDLSGSMALGGKLDQSQELLECLVERSRPRDRFALASFAGRQVSVDVPFGDERGPVLEAAEAWRAYGVTALSDAVARIPELAASRDRPNLVAVLVTDGVENASELTPDEAREILRRARIPVYVLGFEGRAAENLEEEDGQRYSGVLRRLAAFTGGRYFALHSPADTEEACVQISIELRSRYVLGFATKDSGAAAHREIRVAIDRRGLWIAHRRGYAGLEPATLWQDDEGSGDRR